jgi:hypothetical protein
VSSQARTSTSQQTWSVRDAEELIRTLSGVLSARIVTGTKGGIEEIHVLTTDDVPPKQTVRNVESALLAHLDLPVDHRKISVAQTSQGPAPQSAPEGTISLVMEPAPELAETRVVYHSHRSETEGANQLRVTVVLEWGGEAFEGSSLGADLPRPRLEAAAQATLRAMEAVAQARSGEIGRRARRSPVSLGLDGVKVVDAFDRRFCLVGVHALTGRDILSLAGASVANDRLDASVIMATLQATDRWVRGRLE